MYNNHLMEAIITAIQKENNSNQILGMIFQHFSDQPKP